MYALIQSYVFDPIATDDIHHHIQHGLVPLLRRTPGFAVYYWLIGGDGRSAAISVWDDAVAAEHALHLATAYLREHLPAVVGVSDLTAGEVAVHVTRGL